jgi:hypothetical protein
VLLPASRLHHGGNRCPAGDCSMAMTRDCFEPRLAFLLFGSLVVCWEGFAAPPATVDEATERFFTDFDIEILRSVHGGVAPPPPKPHLGHQAGGAGSRSAPQRPELTTLPLQSRPNASPFWIMLRDYVISSHLCCTTCSGGRRQTCSAWDRNVFQVSRQAMADHRGPLHTESRYARSVAHQMSLLPSRMTQANANQP